MSTAKKSKTAAFSRVVTQNSSTIFLGKSELNFWTKNEDFEQCADMIFYSFDFVSVRDGGTTEAPLVGRFCGHNLPQNFLSTGNQLLIRFKTDSSISQEGFRASYRTGIMSLDIKNHVLCINDIVMFKLSLSMSC